MEISQQMEHAKYVIQRLDQYYEGVNTKGNCYLAVNAFVVTAIITGYGIISGKVNFSWVVNGLVALSATASLLALVLTILALNPFLGPRRESSYRSLIFFGSIACTDELEFIQRFTEQTSDGVLKDLIRQIHNLSVGLSTKYAWMRQATYAMLLAFLLLFGAFLSSLIPPTLLV